MTTYDTDSVLEQVSKQIDKFKELLRTASISSHTDIPASTIMNFITSARSAIYRISSSTPIYQAQTESILNMNTNLWRKAGLIYGVLQSLSEDLSSGYIVSVKELIHGELFSDFVEMSDHLLKEGYKDAAAVIVGSALEAHLRQLCFKNGIDIEYERNGDIRPKKADKLNSDLAKTKVYNKTDQKSVTAWLAIRNDAAHGHYENYFDEQVAIMISGIRDFLVRNPA